ncbi:MAG: restriction endonuclease subunit S [Desulfobacteraceae bacterium]|nr:MAG: restriction endonuclease subunit S [Desulfobacteraceae bacterium]
MRSNFKPIGNYVQQANARNLGLSVTNLQGVSINKFFMPSVANINGTDLTKYKVVTKEQFAYNPMHVGRDEVLPIAMLETDDPVIVSPAYVVFEIIDKQALLPEYLMMWCRRPEFDRNAWFTTDSSVRGGFNWNDFCEMKFPVPSPEKQREIVKEYHTIVNRIKLNERLNQKLEETAQAIYKQWFVDFEFPISAEYAAAIGKPELEGQPYKFSSGKMIFKEVLKQEIPKGWELGNLSDIYQFQYGKGNNNPDNGGEYPVYGSNGLIGWYDQFNSEDAPVIGHIGVNCGSIVYAYGKHFVTYNGVICKNRGRFRKFFGYMTLLNKDLKSQIRGSSQPFISYDMLDGINIIIPDKQLISQIEKMLNPLYKKIINNKKQIKCLLSVQGVLLPKLSKFATR